MHRADQQLQWMNKNEASSMVRQEDIANREAELLPSYQPIGELFCDLHDRPELMLAKPKGLTAATCMDALTHAVEAYVSTAATPITAGISTENAEPRRSTISL